MATEWTAIDLEALQRAFATACSESPEERTRFEEMLREKGPEEAYETAAYSCQCRTLKLKCWEAPPCHCRDDVINNITYGHKRKEITLRRRMLAAGLSLFEPDPRAALAAKASSAADTSAA
jgi:hypothetical protein